MSEVYSDGWVYEDTMATKWCRFALVSNSAGTASINRNRCGTPAAGTGCITTQCAHWETRRQAEGRLPMGRCLMNSRDA